MSTKYKRAIFEGNSSLPKPRQPGTLHAHIHSHRMFLQFIENPGVDIYPNVALEEENRKPIRDTREKLVGWLKCLVPFTHKRKAEVEQDLSKVLCEQEYELMAGSTVKEICKTSGPDHSLPPAGLNTTTWCSGQPHNEKV